MFHLILIQYLYTIYTHVILYSHIIALKTIKLSEEVKALLCLNWHIFPQVDFVFLESSKFLLISFSGYNTVLYNIKNTQQRIRISPTPIRKIHYSHTIH